MKFLGTSPGSSCFVARTPSSVIVPESSVRVVWTRGANLDVESRPLSHPFKRVLKWPLTWVLNGFTYCVFLQLLDRPCPQWGCEKGVPTAGLPRHSPQPPGLYHVFPWKRWLAPYAAVFAAPGDRWGSSLQLKLPTP